MKNTIIIILLIQQKTLLLINLIIIVIMTIMTIRITHKKQSQKINQLYETYLMKLNLNHDHLNNDIKM